MPIVKPRLLHLIPSLDRAGAEKQLGLLVRGLAREGFDVHVCALSRGGPLEAGLNGAGIGVTVIGKRQRLDPWSFWRLRRHVVRLRPDLVHAWMFAANAYGYAAARSCGVRRFVAGQRCVDPWKTGLQLAVDRHVGRRADCTVANSPGVRNFYVRHGVPVEKIRVIENGVEPPQPSGITRDELLAELGLPGNCRLVAVIGRLWPQKRVKDAIWAADLLKVIRDDVHLLVIGDGPHRDRLRRFRDQVVIRDKVHLLGHREDVPRIVPHLDALWSTSAYEGQSNAILEAMAAGVPVVATDVPGTRDLVLSGQTGYLVPVGDRAALARATQRLLENPSLAAQLGTAARRRANGQFSVERMVRRHVELYEKLLG
jgi:glycosyltransferase involved in cell wall biosynthesis